MESVNFVEAIGKNEKLCFDCKTSKTPLWRSGPAGPKSLCNACGIRFRKKKSMSGSDKKKEKRELSPSPSNSPTTSLLRTHARNRPIPMDDNTPSSQKKLRVKVVTMGKEMMVMQRHRSPMKKVKRMENEMKKFGEVEEAAYSLMCLSCG